jgi:O-antigen ligase
VKIKSLVRIRHLASTVTLVVTALAVFFALRQEIGVGGVETATTAFNQRSGLWTLSWDGFLRKPWHGWGWMAAWRDPQFLLSSGEPTWMAWGLEWSHSGYHDVLLGGGVPAAFLFAVYLWFSSQRIMASPLRTGVAQMLLIVYILAAATQESFFIGSHYMWALLVAAFTERSKCQTSVDQEYAS